VRAHEPPARALASAKVNLGLRVLRRRDDGFHDLDSVMVRLDLADELVVERAAAGADRLARLPSGDLLDAVGLPLDGRNLVLRAVAAYREALGGSLPALAVSLRKRIPLAAGLGGGSSDAAALLRLVAAHWPGPVDLPHLAAALGSDVPFFLHGAPAARARGRGERLEPVEIPPTSLLLVHPGVGVAASDAYRWWRGRRAERVPWAGLDLANDLEPGVVEAVPAVDEVLATLRGSGLGPVAMSGSGSTCYAVLGADGAAEAAAAAVAERLGRQRGWWARVVRTVAAR
jgi:4-diphosphocytidyl-2-C-methyl-D-erythritol kinase